MKKYPFFSKIGVVIIFITSVVSCIDPFEIDYNLDKSVLIVDGVLSDEIGEQTIIIKQSTPNKQGISSTIFPIEKAKVEILVDGAEKILYTENEVNPGIYIGPKNFKAEPNKTYQLLVTTPNGKTYQSKIEKLIKVPDIKNSYQKLELNGKQIDKNFSAYHNIYVDTEDPAGKGNYYLWSWRLFEKQDVCRTCEPQERYYPVPFPGICVKDLPNTQRNTIYDYICKESCWEILHSSAVNVMDDGFSDGKTITARLVAQVPIYNLNAGALIEIRQQSINSDAYKYMRILVDQNQNSGGLADTSPVSLIGNIMSTNGDNETVAGYFRVADEVISRHWVDRSDILAMNLKPLGLLGGRLINMETPGGADLTRPPFAPCIEGYSRTKIRPIGWQDSK